MEPTAEYWNDVAGPKWVEAQQMMDVVLATHGTALVQRSGVAEGARVVDVGCGCGWLSLELARKGASVVGVDVSRPMLGRAQERANAEGLAVEFVEADAETWKPDLGSIDRIVSRFGVMFFPDPAAAFRNMRSWLSPGGQLVFLCWQGLEANPWLTESAAISARHVEPEPTRAGAPGPFSLGDPNTLRGLLAGAGFERVALVDARIPMRMPGPIDAIVDFYLGRADLQAAMDSSQSARDDVQAAVAEMVSTHHDGTAFQMDAAAWLVTAA